MTTCAGCGKLSLHLFCNECKANYTPKELDEMWREYCNPEFPQGEFPTGREYLEPEEDFWVRGIDKQAYPN